MKVAINTCYGGFGLSIKAKMRYAELKGIKLYLYTDKRDNDGNYIPNKYKPYIEEQIRRQELVHYFTKPLNEDGNYEDEAYWYLGHMEDKRNDPDLIKVIEELGEEANGDYADLKIVEIPDDVEYEIEEYDGVEWVAEKHRIWR